MVKAVYTLRKCLVRMKGVPKVELDSGLPWRHILACLKKEKQKPIKYNKFHITFPSPFFSLPYRCLACLIWFYGQEMLGLYTRTPTCTANGTEFLKVQLKEHKTSWYFEVLPLSHHTTKSMEPLGFISTITDNSYKLLFCTMVWHKVLGCPTEVFNYHEIYYIFQGCAALYYSIWRAKFGGYLDADPFWFLN